jgi:Lrp/AsnC family leucine-responsive transcriptional regulator
LPYKLDDIDAAIITSLMDDGRKSFRKIAKEASISTPTAKARYQRLVNLGLIKSISPILDMSKIIKQDHIQITNKSIQKKISSSIVSGFQVNVTCAYCKGNVFETPKVLKFGEYERFFCCTSCKTLYEEKYGRRIDSILKQDIEN